MTKNQYQRKVAEVLGTRPVVFNPDLARVFGSVKAGLFLNQLLYWWDKGKDPGWIYKTIKEIESETALSRAEQETAIKICKKMGVLEVKVQGIPAKRNFKLNIDKIEKLIISSLRESSKQVCEKVANKFAENQQTKTESTTETTKDIKSGDKSPHHSLISFFYEQTEKIRGFKPEINEKDAGLLAVRLKKYAPEQIKDLIVWYLESKDCDRLGATLSICLSSAVINKFKEENLIK